MENARKEEEKIAGELISSPGWAMSVASPRCHCYRALGKFCHQFSSFKSRGLAPALCQSLGWALGRAS